MPKDDPKDPVKVTTFEYDAAGNLVMQTQPKGTLTTKDDKDFVTTYGYDVNGKGDGFDTAMARFAETYADQNERDYGVLRMATDEGRVKVVAPPR